MNREFFYSLEGGEGSGKSTVAEKLKLKLENEGYKTVITREPGGIKPAEEIRNVILENDLSIESEILLFAAARNEHLEKKIIPNLLQKKIVICDRFVDSSYVYQGVSRGDYIKEVSGINQMIVKDNLPIRTYLLDIDPKKALGRIAIGEREKNRFDDMELEFHERIRYSYLNLAKKNKDRIFIIDADDKIDNIVEKIYEDILLNLNGNRNKL